MENSVWNAFRSGDEVSFREIYDQYYSPLFNYGHKFTFDDYLIEEAVQDLFIKLWKNRTRIKETQSVKNYLYKAFRRTLIRKLNYAPSIMAFPVTEDKIQFYIELGHEHALINNEQLKEIQVNLEQALQKMTSRQREIIHLRYYEELDYEDIAQIMQLSVKHTYKLMYRAVDALKANMSGFQYLLLICLLSSAKK